jgi:hypothetical protein
MLTLRKFSFYVGIIISILVTSSFAVAQDASSRKEVEALYAKQDKAIKDQDVAAFRATETKDFDVTTRGPGDYLRTPSDFPRTGPEARAEVEQFLFSKEVTSFTITTTIRSIEPGQDGKDLVVESTQCGKVARGGEPDGYEGYSKDLLILTDGGWKVKRHSGADGIQRETVDCKPADNSAWSDLKALYAKRDKAFANKDLDYIKSLETDDYTEASTTAGGEDITLSRAAVDAANEKLLKRKDFALDASMVALYEGKDKNEVVATTSEGMSYDGTVAAGGFRHDTWVRSGNSWKLKKRK